MASNKIYQIHFIAGNPDMFTKVRSTENMTRLEADETWQRMIRQNGLNWRIWLTRNGDIIERSIREKIWQDSMEVE